MLPTVNENKWLCAHPKLNGISLMDHLFNRLNGMYASKWISNFRDDLAIENWKEAWAEAFDEDGLTPNDIAVGIKNCRRMFDWPPSLAEFVKACRPWTAPELAHQIAVTGMAARAKGEMGEWPHPAVYWTAVRIGAHDLLNMSYSGIKSRWEAAFTDVLSKDRWGPIPVPAVALPAPGKTTLDRAEADKRLEEVGAAAAFNSDRFDHKSWAKKILEKPKGRNAMSISMAKRALGVEA